MLDREVQQYTAKDLCLCSVVRIVEELEKNYDIPNTIRYDGVQKSDDAKQKTNNHQTKEALMHLNDKIAIASQLTPLTY